jgi:NAD(P)-dependent dehydrogenase (short-subunit alcohol dehydrogenase family)
MGNKAMSNQLAVIPGASGGIGLELAKVLAGFVPYAVKAAMHEKMAKPIS